MAYAIKTGQFEGPLDLLLELIEKRKFSINDVSLANITDQYVEYLSKLENFPMEEVIVFISVASTLILIKSRSLMPSLLLTEEEEKSIEELEERLKIYRRIRELSIHVKNIFGNNPIFSREGFRGIEVGFIEPEGLDVDKMVSVLREITEKLPIKEYLPEKEVRKVISLEDKILELTGRIQNSLEISFSEFVVSENKIDQEELKIEVIISFLAMLELVKQGIIMVKQTELFDNINICSVINNHE
ncbi:segregation/condensation protein A [Patescibacteria group bacterium]|nr:segregation/condensation protein A [Patescibacteria group bacterium]